MSPSQFIVFLTLSLTLVLFISGRWRYDLVALFALLIVVVSGLVPAEEAFAGFGHQAVITVAAVLVISRGLSNAGLVDQAVRFLSRIGPRPVLLLIALTSLVTLLSAFMNNVGALAIFMPVAIQVARRGGQSPSLFLMPMAFGSLLGGLMTMIGTPPNIIIASIRAQHTGRTFQMFDFTPVGLLVALTGVLFIVLVGTRLIPHRQGQASREELFQIEAYTTELVVPPACAIIGRTIEDINHETEADIVVLGLVRGAAKIALPPGTEVLKAGDILIVEASSQDLKIVLDRTKLELVGSKTLCHDFLGDDTMFGGEPSAAEAESMCTEPLASRDIMLFEAVIKLDSSLIGRTVAEIDLRKRYGLNLLAVARHGSRVQNRLKAIRFQAGDVLLLQGSHAALRSVLRTLGCFPLAERDFQLGESRRMWFALGIFVTAIVLAALNILPIQISLVAAALIMVLTGVVRIRALYETIDWPIIVLLGAMIPVGQALETTGGAQLIADQITVLASFLPISATLLVLLIGTMILSNVINNAATAVLMAPVAIGVAQGLHVSIDPFLMIVAVGSSTPFLTPIGHQSNTLVMGPGGYYFGDFWRLGLPLSIIVISCSVPCILWFWPL